LTVWNKPSNACLASRFPYGTRISQENVSKIEAAEKIISDKTNIRQLRVRHFGDRARIEVLPNEINGLLSSASFNPIAQGFHGIGYSFISVDLKGYRTGSLNENVVKGSR